MTSILITLLAFSRETTSTLVQNCYSLIPETSRLSLDHLKITAQEAFRAILVDRGAR